MTIVYSLFIALLLVGVYSLWQSLYEKNKNVRKDNYNGMKERLLTLLNKDGYKSEMDEGVIIVNYRQERFRIHFSDSEFGSAYARVTVVDDYVMDGMDEIHPLIVDNLMGRASSGNPRLGNISFNDHCTCFYGTDVHKVKDFYLGLRKVLDMLVHNEGAVRQEFDNCRAEYGRKQDPEEKNHIGFRTSSSVGKEEEKRHVAAETNVKPE